MYAYKDVTSRLALHSDTAANDPITLRPSLAVRADSIAVASSAGGARMISFAPCVTIQPIEIEECSPRETFQTVRVPRNWSEVPVTDPYATYRPTGDTTQPYEALPDEMTQSTLAILASMRIV